MKSQYGDRDTVGQIYVDAQKNPVHLEIGEVNAQLVSSFVDDLNKELEKKPYGDRPYYINIVEKRDAQMQNIFVRSFIKSLYRPYPEDNTLVFYIDVPKNRVLFCWDVPHHSEIPNIMANYFEYPEQYIKELREWLKNDLSSFGFVKVSLNSHQVEGYSEKVINHYRENYVEFCKARGMNEKEIESEKRVGYFWIPNPNWKDHSLELHEPKVSLII